MHKCTPQDGKPQQLGALEDISDDGETHTKLGDVSKICTKRHARNIACDKPLVLFGGEGHVRQPHVMLIVLLQI